MSPLDVALHGYAVCEIREGWRLRFEPMERVMLHYVLAGTGELRTGEVALAYAPHSILLVPAGVAQSLGAAGTGPVGEARAEKRCSLLDDGLVRYEAGGRHDGLVICGTLVANDAGRLGLFARLDGPVVEHMSNSSRSGTPSSSSWRSSRTRWWGRARSRRA